MQKRTCLCGNTYTKKRQKDSNKCQDCIKKHLYAWRQANPGKCYIYAKRGKTKAKIPGARFPRPP